VDMYLAVEVTRAFAADEMRVAAGGGPVTTP
jgi:hypothetical protein